MRLKSLRIYVFRNKEEQRLNILFGISHLSFYWSYIHIYVYDNWYVSFLYKTH